MKPGQAGALALIGLLLAGCQGQTSQRGPVAVSSSTSSSTTNPPSDAPGVSVGRARKPRTGELSLLTTIPGMWGRTREGILALSPGGHSLVAVNPPATEGRLIAQSRMQVMSGTKRTWLPATPKEEQPRQSIDGTLPDDSTAAWMESRSTDLFDVDWKVFAWSHGKVRLLADSDKFTKGHPLAPAAGGEHLMASDGKNVWWSFRKAGSEMPIATNIATAPISGASTARVVIEGADLPTVDPDGGLMYVRDPYTSPHSVGYDIHRLRGTRDEILYHGTVGEPGFISELCVSQDVVAWAVPVEEDHGGTIMVMNRTTRATHTIHLRDSARATALACGDDFVAWGNGSGNGDAGQYLWSTKSGSLVKLGEAFGLSWVTAAGPYVAWTVLPTAPQAAGDTRLARWDGG